MDPSNVSSMWFILCHDLSRILESSYREWLSNIRSSSFKCNPWNIQSRHHLKKRQQHGLIYDSNADCNRFSSLDDIADFRSHAPCHVFLLRDRITERSSNFRFSRDLLAAIECWSKHLILAEWFSSTWFSHFVASGYCSQRIRQHQR